MLAPLDLSRVGLGHVWNSSLGFAALAPSMIPIAFLTVHPFWCSAGHQVEACNPPPEGGHSMGRHPRAEKWTDKCGQQGVYPIVGYPPCGPHFRVRIWAGIVGPLAAPAAQAKMRALAGPAERAGCFQPLVWTRGACEHGARETRHMCIARRALPRSMRHVPAVLQHRAATCCSHSLLAHDHFFILAVGGGIYVNTRGPVPEGPPCDI